MRKNKESFIQEINKYLIGSLKSNPSFSGIKLVSFDKVNNSFNFKFGNDIYSVRFISKTEKGKSFIQVRDFSREDFSLLQYTLENSNFLISGNNFTLIQNRGFTIGQRRAGSELESKELINKLGFNNDNIITDGNFSNPDFNKILNEIFYWCKIRINAKLILKGEKALEFKNTEDISENLFVSNDESEQEELEKYFKKNKTRREILHQLQNIKDIDSEEIVINRKTYKRDNKTIALLKIFRYYKCQICGHSITKKDGGKYIEAAHIKAKHLKGKETADNIILLCPNHHKEFDLGELQIIKQDSQQIEFILNGKRHKLKLSLV